MCTYFGQLIKHNKSNPTAKVNRRIKLQWEAFGKLKETLRNKKQPTALKK